MADIVRRGDAAPAAPDHAGRAQTMRLQRGALSCWPGENTANVKIGELHAVLNHDQAEWLHDRLGECLMEMKKKAAPATDIGRAASAAAASRGW